MTRSFLVKHPEAEAFTKQQLSIFWTPDEIKVEKDVQDFLVNMTPSERHGVSTVLKLFTLYEMYAGAEYWGGKVMREFEPPEIIRMAATFSMTELAIHQPFYTNLNEALGLHTDEFYNSYAKDPVLAKRKEFIDRLLLQDLPLSLAVFSLVEGVVLYSSFAFLKHFQSQGKNKLVNVVRGINFSVRDENLHALAGAWLYKLSVEESKEYYERIYFAAMEIYAHECQIIDMIFSQGKIEGITDVQLKHFVESRINLCLKNLGLQPQFDTKYNPVGEWFYKGINSYQMNDFFSGAGREYNRNWTEEEFNWK